MTFIYRDSGMLSLIVNTLMLKSFKVHLIEDGEGETTDPVERRDLDDEEWDIFRYKLCIHCLPFILTYIFGCI